MKTQNLVILLIFFIQLSACFDTGDFFRVVSPSSLSNFYLTSPFSTFGPREFTTNGSLVLANPADACAIDNLINKDSLSDKVVLVSGE